MNKKYLKDKWSAITHFIGMMMAIFSGVPLLLKAVKEPSSIYLISSAIYLISMILLYFASTLYHSLDISEQVNRNLQKFDHMMIYVLIAATYTPICLGPLRGSWGWSIFGVVWGLAVLGIILTAVWIKAPRWLTTSIYLGMGWLVVIMAYPFITIFKELNALGTVLWLLLGGIFYTIGGVIYGLKKAPFTTKYFGFHEIFHIFVMLGSFCQFWFVIKYLLLITVNASKSFVSYLCNVFFFFS